MWTNLIVHNSLFRLSRIWNIERHGASSIRCWIYMRKILWHFWWYANQFTSTVLYFTPREWDTCTTFFGTFESFIIFYQLLCFITDLSAGNSKVTTTSCICKYFVFEVSVMARSHCQYFERIDDRKPIDRTQWSISIGSRSVFYPML